MIHSLFFIQIPLIITAITTYIATGDYESLKLLILALLGIN